MNKMGWIGILVVIGLIFIIIGCSTLKDVFDGVEIQIKAGDSGISNDSTIISVDTTEASQDRITYLESSAKVYAIKDSEFLS